MQRTNKHTCHLLCLILIVILLSGFTPESLVQVPTPGWSYTGGLSTARAGHSATLLPDGKVLVFGGFSNADGSPLSSAELYDPSTGTSSPTGSLNVPRVGHTATLLGNGKVLVAGGWANRCCLQADLTNTAELYDPATGEWSFTGNLNVLRVGHTATLLSNGKVLFAGGGLAGAFSATDTAELYDPVTGRWSLTGKLSGPRVDHTATLLQDGKVLVAGGCSDEECFFIPDSPELYDPSTGTWSITGNLNTPRYGNIPLTLLPNGDALLAGGGAIFSIPFNTAELYNPATGRWSLTGSLINRRYGGTVMLLPSGQVLVVGTPYDPANPGPGEDVISAELYDPAAGSWSSLPIPNFSLGSATLLANGNALFLSAGSAALFDYRATSSGTVSNVSAAGYRPMGLASEAIAAAFGTGLATATSAASTSPLPMQLAGTTVKVKDSAGVEQFAPLFFVSPDQINYQIPAGTALGAAAVTITDGNGATSNGIALVNKVGPSLFSANADGQGVAAAFAVRVKADGSQSYEEVVQFDAAQGRFIARPLDLGAEGEQVFLALFGTGVRGRSSLSSVITTIGGAYGEVSFAGAQTEFGGLDQINVLLPRSLTGRGEVDVLLTVEAQVANPVRIRIK